MVSSWPYALRSITFIAAENITAPSAPLNRGQISSLDELASDILDSPRRSDDAPRNRLDDALAYSRALYLDSEYSIYSRHFQPRELINARRNFTLTRVLSS